MRVRDKLIARLDSDLGLKVVELERVQRGRHGKAAGTFAWIAKLENGSEIGSEDTMLDCVRATNLTVLRSAIATMSSAVCANK